MYRLTVYCAMRSAPKSRSAVASPTQAGTLLLKRLATARRTPSTLAEYARAVSPAGDATDMPASACALF